MLGPPKHVFRWDLDKTYLRTEFDSIGDLIKAARETASDKKAYPGATALLRALKQEPGHRICIVSGSPSQMRRVLTAKLALDGIDYDEFVLKNNLRNMLRGRFRALRAQIPYKLPVLLKSHVGMGGADAQTLFGDDAEADAIIYSLYGDLLSGAVPLDELERVLHAARAYDDEIAKTMFLAERAVKTDSVKRIMIHLDMKSPTALFAQFGKRLVPIYNYFQAALVLYSDGVLSARQVLFVSMDMLTSPEYELTTLANSLQDLLRRGRLDKDVARQLSNEVQDVAETGALAEQGLPPFEHMAEAFAERVRQLGDAPPHEWPDEDPRLDYVSLVDHEHQNRRKRRKGGFSFSS